MNILHLLSQKELTGAEVYASTLIDTQKEHTVYQVSNGFFKSNSAAQIALPVETQSFFQFWSSVFALRKILKEKNIHVIHAHSRAASKLAFYARFGLKIGLVSSVHGRQHLSFSKRWFNQYGDFIVPVCEKISQQLKKEFKYNPRFIKTILNPIDDHKFKALPRSVLSKDNVLKIAIIGRTSGPKKTRTEIFLKNFSQILDQKGIRYSFTLVGGEVESIESYQKDYPTEINSEYLQKFDLVCGSGRVAMEALLSAVSCIAFGEIQYIGLINESNFSFGVETNFGDVGDNFNSPHFNATQAYKDIDLLFSNTVNYLALAEKTKQTYSLRTISQRILRLYESAYFIRNYKWWIPILMYHKIPTQDLNSKHKIYVNKDNFEKHLKFFQKKNFTTLTFNDLSEYRKGRKDWATFPSKPLVLTFDDGYQDNLENADQLLKKYNMKAQIYLLADQNVSANEWDYQQDPNEKHQIVKAEDRHLWKKTHFTIGSHGLSHQRLPAMSREQKIIELNESKKRLESEFNIPVITYAYTYGDTNAECAELAQDVGYEYALNTDTGGLILEENPYAIFRVNIFPDETELSLWKKTNTFYRRYFHLKRQR